MSVAPSTTWLLVSTRPEGLSTMPVAAACADWSPSTRSMSTRAGSTREAMVAEGPLAVVSARERQTLTLSAWPRTMPLPINRAAIIRPRRRVRRGAGSGRRSRAQSGSRRAWSSWTGGQDCPSWSGRGGIRQPLGRLLHGVLGAPVPGASLSAPPLSSPVSRGSSVFDDSGISSVSSGKVQAYTASFPLAKLL